MTVRFRQLALQLRSSYWFVPAMLSLGAIILSILTGWIDRAQAEAVHALLGWSVTDTPEGARQLLSTISTGMISVAGTVFAITIAAVAYASGTYGPRLLFNFMTDRGNQFALGVFIATYLYCLLILRTVRGGEDDAQFVPQLSLLIGLGLALLSVAVLVYFLHHVPASIRINSVIAAIGRQAIDAVHARFPEPGNVEPITPALRQSRPIAASQAGYVELIDFQKLAETAKAQDVRLFLACRTGDFVQPGLTLLHVEGPMDDDCDAALHGAFAFGNHRTAEQDIEYLIDEMVEIAVRALSPSMNDPFTAITALFWIGAVTGALASRNLDRDPDGAASSARGVYPLADDFGHFLKRGFGGVMPAAATHPMVAPIFLETLLRVAATGCGPVRMAAIGEQLARLRDQAREHLRGPNREDLETTVRQVQAQLDMHDR